MHAPYGPYFALVPEFLPQRLGGPAMAVINAAGAVGGSAVLMLAVTVRGHAAAPVDERSHITVEA